MRNLTGVFPPVFFDKQRSFFMGKKHMYAKINCNGECGHCIALVCDGEVVKGPPFHLHCGCVLTQKKNQIYKIV